MSATTYPGHRLHLHGVLCALTLLLACRSEPYPLEGVLTGELPDQDLDLEAELADPGEEMHDPPHDHREYSSEYCTAEDWEAHRKSVTHGTHVDDEGLWCPKPPASPKPASPGAAPAPSVAQPDDDVRELGSGDPAAVPPAASSARPR